MYTIWKERLTFVLLTLTLQEIYDGNSAKSLNMGQQIYHIYNLYRVENISNTSSYQNVVQKLKSIFKGDILNGYDR